MHAGILETDLAVPAGIYAATSCASTAGVNRPPVTYTGTPTGRARCIWLAGHKPRERERERMPSYKRRNAP